MTLVVYVGGYTSAAGSVGVYTLDLRSGALTSTGTGAAGANPSFLAVDPAKRRLYAVNEGGASSTVTALAVDPGTGALTRLNTTVVGNGPAHVSVDRSGAWVLVANYGGGTVVVVPATDAGVGAVRDTKSPGQLAHQILTDASNRYAFVPCKGSDLVAQYRFDADAGTLIPNTPAVLGTDAGAGPRHLALHPNGRFAYLINETNSTVTALSLGPAGTLTALQTVSTLPASFTGANTGAEVVVHPSGRWLYASNRGHDSIAQFAIDQTAGTLSLVGHTPSGGQTPRCIALDPSGQVLLAANQGSNRVTTFFLDGDAGVPTATGQSVTFTSPSFVGVVALP